MKLKLFIIATLFTLYGCKDELRSELPFLLHYPNKENNTKLYPLVICLHDANGRGNDNLGRGSEAFKLLTDSTQQIKTPAFVLIPQCPKAKKWVNCYWTSGNYDMSILEITDQLKDVNDLIDDVVEKHNIDPARIYITGQSMGSYGVWDLAVRKPHFFAAGLMISGGGDTNKVHQLLDLPLKMYNSEKDPIVPVRGARAINYKFKKLEASKFYYKEYKTKNHNIWHQVWSQEKVIKWMFSQKRSLH